MLIEDEINDFFNGTVKLFDSTDLLALKLKKILEKENLLASTRTENNKFYVSDLTPSFEESANRFYEEDIHLDLKKLVE